MFLCLNQNQIFSSSLKVESLANEETPFIVDIIADETLDKKRQPLIELDDIKSIICGS